MIDNPGEYSPRFVATMQGSMTDAVEKDMIRVIYFTGSVVQQLTCGLRECVDDIWFVRTFS